MNFKKHDFSFGGFPNAADQLLLKAALKKGAEAVANWQEWSRRHKLETDVTLDRYRVLPLVFENLSATPEAAGLTLPMGLEGAFKKTFFTNSLLLQHLLKMQSMLEERGIPVMVLKGMGMILSGAYPRLGSRFQFDYDILVPFGQKEAATLLFERAGYRPYYEEGRELHLRHAHSTGFTHPDLLKFGSFDLHWLPLYLQKHPRTTALFFQEKIEVSFNGLRFFVPPPELLLLQSIVHGLKLEHTSFTQWVCDAAIILERCPGFDWGKLARFSETLQCGYFVKKGLSFLQEVIGIEFSAGAQTALRSIRHSAVEPYLFAFHNKKKKGIADMLLWRLHDERQLFPEKSLPASVWEIIRRWRGDRKELNAAAFLRLLLNRAGHLLRNSAPDYPVWLLAVGCWLLAGSQ